MTTDIISKIDLRIRGKVYSVFSLSGEESLYKPFLFDVIILINFTKWQDSWVFETAELLLPDRTITGMITQEDITNSDQQNLLKIYCQLEPRFVILRNQYLSKNYLSKNIKDIFTDSLLLAGYNISQIQWQSDIPDNKPYLFQAPQESDQDFLKRLCSHHGYFYYFDNGKVFVKNQNNNPCISIKHTVQQPTGPHGEGDTIPYHTLQKTLDHPAHFQWPPSIDPPMPLLFTAHIESESPYADIDDQGNYTYRLNCDEDQKNYTQAMPLLKKLSPYVQLHFPLRDQAEVLVSHLYGFSHEPIIMGSVHNSEQQSPVTSQNPTQHILKSQSGNLICADDSALNQRWLIQTSQAENYLKLNATAKQCYLFSQGNIIFNAHSNIMPRSKENMSETIGHQFFQIAQHQFSSLTQLGNLTHYSYSDYVARTQNNIFLNASQDMLLNSQHNFVLQSQQNMQIDINGQQFSIQSSSGNITMSSGKDIQILGNGEGSILISNGGSSLEITKDGHININADQIGLTGQPIFSVMPS